MNRSAPYTPAVEGCWFDSARGIYIGMYVIEEAQAKGLDMFESGYTENDCHPEPTDLNPDGSPDYANHHYFEATDAAADYLNTLAPAGYWIGFNDGDFGMYKLDDDEAEDDDDDEAEDDDGDEQTRAINSLLSAADAVLLAYGLDGPGPEYTRMNDAIADLRRVTIRVRGELLDA